MKIKKMISMKEYLAILKSFKIIIRKKYVMVKLVSRVYIEQNYNLFFYSLYSLQIFL